MSHAVLSAMLGAAVLLIAIAPASADLPDYTPDEFDLLFRTAPLDNLAEVGPAPAITGNVGVDERIRSLAEGRGYRRRPLPAGSLDWTDGVPMQPAMAIGWEALQADASRHGVSIQAISGFRSHADQVSVFVGKLTGTSDSAIDRRLRTAAAPGYSKHHTGYALDLTAPGAAFYGFGGTTAWRFLASDNAEAAKRSGFIPSYPSGASSQGPIPEPWEWVYVGVDVVNCGRTTIGMPSGMFDDVVSCPDYPLSRGSAAHVAVRGLGWSPPPAGLESTFPDDDGLTFESDIDLLASEGRIAGCDEGVCPFDYLTRAELAAFVVRAFELGSVPASGTSFVDIDSSANSDDIRRLDGLGLLGGCGEGLFCPEQQAVRADLVDVILAAYDTATIDRPGVLVDSIDSVFVQDIAWLASEGITRGCNPPFNDLFCPDEVVTRGQMAAFLVRALDLPAGSATFTDTGGSVFAGDIAGLASAGITRGCDPPFNDLFCPDEVVTRGQMAAFLVRALDLPAGSATFTDTGGSVFAGDIAGLASAGITRGCNPPDSDRFCPNEPVTRGQMAAFLNRALAP